MAVSATDQNDTIAWFSNVGSDIAVAAPGVDVLSTYPGGYQALSGTSMAAPHVSAVAGLVLSVDGGFRNDQVVDAIERGAVGMGPGCPNQAYGYGRLDAAGALGQAQLMIERTASSVEQSLPFKSYLPLVRNQSCG
jgi:subtilisin family serine protease